MKKKLFFLSVLIFCSNFVVAKIKPFGSGFSWELSEKGTLTISGSGKMPDFNYHKKKGSNSPWAKYKNEIRYVIIDDGIESIGNWSFNDCRTLEMVVLPKSISVIGNNAFSDCRSLRDINLPNELERIGYRSFYCCISLKNLTFPKELLYIGEGAFWLTGLISVTIPNKVQTIDNCVFYNCTNLSSITIPSNVKKIGRDAFFQCFDLKSVKIQDGVETIGEEAFGECESLTSITIPGSVKKIASNAFRNSKKLRSVVIQDGVETIGEEAFYGCEALDTIRVAQSVKIMKYAFWHSGETKSLFDGYIKCLPSYVKSDKYYGKDYSGNVKGNAGSFGISDRAVKQYEDDIKSDKGDVIWKCPDNGYTSKYKDEDGDYYIVRLHRKDNGRDVWDEGVISKDAKWIVPLIKGRREITRKISDNQTVYYIVKDNSGTGIMDKNGKWIVPSSIGCDWVTGFTYNNRMYYRVSKNHSTGLCNEDGEIVVPIKYENAWVVKEGYYRFKSNGYYGVMTNQYKIIIPPSRGYTLIGQYDESKKSFSYQMKGFKGECNINGRQISKIKVEEPKKNETINRGESNNKSIVTNSKQIDSTKSLKNSTNIKPGLLYAGFYNRNSQGRNLNTGQFTGFSGPDWEEKVEIYKDSIVVQNTMYKYSGTSEQWKMYSCDMGSFGKYVYFVDQNYNMKLHIVQNNPYMGGSDIFVYTMKKDGTQNQKYYGDSNGQITSDLREVSTSSVQHSATSNSSSSRPICKTCHGGGVCNSCHGKGKRTDNQFGTGTNYARSCGVCGGSGRCPVCKGSGYR